MDLATIAESLVIRLNDSHGATRSIAAPLRSEVCRYLGKHEIGKHMPRAGQKIASGLVGLAANCLVNCFQMSERQQNGVPLVRRSLEMRQNQHCLISG